MTSTKLALGIALAVSLTLGASPAFAQARPRSGAPSGGQAVHPPSVGTAVPRPGYPGGGHPVYGHYPNYPYRPYYPYYPPYYRPYYYPGFSWGLGYYGYPYGYYPYGSVGFGFGYGYGSIGFGFGFGYPAYGYPAYGYPAYGYPAYGYPAYSYPGYGGYPYGSVAGGPVVVPGESYGGVKIQDAPKNAQVYVDGSYVGVVDEFDGTFQQMNLQAGAHHIEIRAQGFETLSFDVQTQPGQTINYRARMRPAQ